MLVAVVSRINRIKSPLKKGEAKLETFTEPKELVENPHYKEQRQKSLAGHNNRVLIQHGDGSIAWYVP